MLLVALNPVETQFTVYQTVYCVGQNYLRKKAWCILGSLKAELLHDNKTKTLVYWDQNGQEQKKLITPDNCEQFAIRDFRKAQKDVIYGTFGSSNM
jgi:hypothetical protein